MSQLKRFAGICMAGVFVSGLLGLVTAGSVTAQGNRPAAPVQVVNSAAHAVPVDVTRMPAVQISGLPAVQVTSLPAVQVSSLPEVQVGNDSSNPVPVNVTNLPTAPLPEPVTMSGVVFVEAGQIFGSAPLTAVPAGKRLVIEKLNYETQTPDHTNRHLVFVQTEHNGLVRSQRFMADRGFDIPNDGGFSQIGEHDVQIFADAGTQVVIRIIRSKGTAATTIHLTATGHLVPAP